MSKRPSKESLAELPEIDVSKARNLGRGLLANRRIGLRSLREAIGKTQTDVARVAEMDQGDVSKLESRKDMHVSTLGRYARALGGKLEIAVVVGDRRYMIEV